jgi:hypothetical protein
MIRARFAFAARSRRPWRASSSRNTDARPGTGDLILATTTSTGQRIARLAAGLLRRNRIRVKVIAVAPAPHSMARRGGDAVLVRT